MPLDGLPWASYLLVDKKGEVEIRRVRCDLSQIFKLVDAKPDYPAFETARHQYGFKRMCETGRYWGTFLED